MIEHVWIDRNELEQLRADHAAMWDRISRDERTIADLREKNRRLEDSRDIGVASRAVDEAARLTRKVEGLTNQRDMFANGYANRGARVAELEQENERLKAERDGLKSDQLWLTFGHQKKNREISSLENALNNLRQTYRETNVARNTLAEKVMRLEQENENHRTTLAEDEAYMRRLEADLGSMRGGAKELRQENETLKANLTAAEGEMRRLQNELECWESEGNRMRGYEG